MLPVPLIPRSHTYPTLRLPGSPRQLAGSLPGLKSWRLRHFRPSNAVAEGTSTCWRRLTSSRSFARLLAVLYGLALLLLPLLYVSSARLLAHPATAGGAGDAAAASAAGDAAAASAAAAASPDGLFIAAAGDGGGLFTASGASRLPQLAVLGNRRLALQRVGAAPALAAGGSSGSDVAAADQQAQLWPDTGLAQLNYGAKTAGLPRVEYRDAG